jgi:hypothetical protein
VAAVSALTLGCLVCCGVGEGRLGRSLRSEASRENETVQLAGLTSFPWDRVCLFGPYTSRNEAEACLGFVWLAFESTGIDMADQFSLMVFAASGRVVHVERLSRQLDFSEEILKRPLLPGEAIFKVRVAKSGRRELVPGNGAAV